MKLIFDKNKESENEIVPDETEINTSGEEVSLSDYYPEDEESLVSGETEQDTVVFSTDNKKKKPIKNGKLTKKQKIGIVIVFILYAIIVAAIVWMALYKPKPKTEEIPFDITDPVEDDDPETDMPDDEKNAAVVTKDFKESGDSYNILLVGHDQLAHLADVTMLANFNTKDNTVSVMQIPRDTYFSKEYITGKINAYFTDLYGAAWNRNEENPSLSALKDYAKELEKSLCVKIHYVVLLNLNGFANIVDSVGGVDIYVPHAMYYSDPAQGLYIDIPAGPQHLDGKTSEGFVRFRSGYIQADLGRVNAQKIFLTAFFNKIKATVKSLDVNSLKALIDTVIANIDTTLSDTDLLFFAKEALKINLEDISMQTLPGYVSGSYYVMNRAATLNAINTHFNVYNKNISDSIFDRNRLFCNEDQSYISSVYYGDASYILDSEYTADKIDENSIYIPRN